MKQILVIVCLLFCFKGKAVDAGYAYRFYVNITLKNGEKQYGYIYKYSYKEFKIYNTNTIEFLSNNYIKKITVYPHIIAANVGRHNIDFVLEGTGKQISFDEIDDLRVTEFVYFDPDERLKELSKAQYQLIKASKAKFEVIEDVNLYENGKFILFTWDEHKELSVTKNTIAKEIKEQWKRYIEVEIIQSEKFNSFMKKLKEALLKENILLIQFADAL
jgi:hypothetical protein